MLTKNEKMVSVKTNAIDIRVTSNHRMIVACKKKHSKWKIVPANNIVGKRVILPAHGVATPEMFSINNQCDAKKTSTRISSLTYIYKNKYNLSSKKAKLQAQKEVAIKNLLQYKNPHQLSLLECSFIGFWIGDGTKSCGRVSLSQSCAYPDTIEWIDKIISKLGISHSRQVYSPASKSKRCSVRWTLARGTGGRQQRVPCGYYSLEPYFDKNGSDLLWGLNNKQFNAFLHGWWMADGVHHGKHRNGKRVSCANKTLLDKLQLIATCRGIRTSLRKCSSPRKNNHSQQWTLSWCDAAKISLAKNLFQIELRYKKERVWCVTSVTGNIIIRRNGKVAVVGNTTGFDSPCIDAIAILRATMSAGLFAQICGRGFRVYPGKTDCLILDFGENIKRHGPIDAIEYGRCKRTGAVTGEAPTKTCPNCGLEVLISTKECECGYTFPIERTTHNGEADAESEILSKPQEWIVEEVAYGRHEKKKQPDAIPSLRVDYTCVPADSDGGNLGKQRISEWVCIEHGGFAYNKAYAWWKARSVAPMPLSVDEAVDFARRGALAWPERITTIREGHFWRILKAELNEKPLEWIMEELVDDFEEVPF
jgi:hypothetical protein